MLRHLFANPEQEGGSCGQAITRFRGAAEISDMRSALRTSCVNPNRLHQGQHDRQVARVFSRSACGPIRPLSRALPAAAWRCVIICMIIEALIYGPMPIAKIDMRRSAPPPKTSTRFRRPPPPFLRSLSDIGGQCRAPEYAPRPQRPETSSSTNRSAFAVRGSPAPAAAPLASFLSPLRRQHFSTVPPAACSFSCALLLNLCACTVNFLVSSPLPRIFRPSWRSRRIPLLHQAPPA